MSKSIYVIIGILCVPFFSWSQISQPARVEIPLAREDDSYIVIPAAKDGLFLFKELERDNEGNKVIQVMRLDDSFDVQWVRTQAIGTSYEYIDHYFKDGRAYLLFNNFSAKDRNLALVTFDLLGNIQNLPIRNFIPFTYFDFNATGEAILIGGYFNYRPVVIFYNFEERIPRILPGLFNDRSTIIELRINDNGTFDVLLTGRTLDKKNTIFINTFDMTGNMVKKITLDTDRFHNLLFGRSQLMEGNAQIVAGVYGRFNSEYSRGLFVANVNQFGEQKMKFYNYAELKNFFSYMKARREKRVRDRIERRKIKGKKIKFNYRVLVHNLVESGDQYILLGEAFYPKYRNVSGSSSGSFFNPVWTVNRGLFSNSLVFDGYRYTHAVVMGFDKSGNLLWDNSFEINDVLSFELEQFVHAATSGSNVALLYVFDNQIRSKIIHGDEVLEGKELLDIKLKYDTDQVTGDATNVLGLEKWYDNVFFTYGTQLVKNVQVRGVEVERNVFFINKVVYE